MSRLYDASLTSLKRLYLTPLLTNLFPVHPFSTPWKHYYHLTVFWYFQGVEKGCIGNEWVKGMLWDRLQILLLILSEFKQINWLLFPLKSSEKPDFSKGKRSSLIRYNYFILELKFGAALQFLITAMDVEHKNYKP